MNFRNILQEIEKADPEVYEKLSGRRQVLKGFGSKVAMAALPLAIGSLFKKAYGQTTPATPVLDALNFALQLEYFEYNFYHTANAALALIPTADKAGFATIEAHEQAHVNFLIAAINSLGGTPYTPPHYDATLPNPMYVPAAYDFTKGNAFNTFSDYATFLTIAATFEDTGIHAYQGQIPALLGTPDVLQQTFQIQTVEGRHAAHVRLLRRLEIGAIEDPAPWITNDIAPALSLKSYYTGEDQQQQDNITTGTLPDAYAPDGVVPKASATAAFDEPFSKTSIQTLIAPFLLA